MNAGLAMHALDSNAPPGKRKGSQDVSSTPSCLAHCDTDAAAAPSEVVKIRHQSRTLIPTDLQCLCGFQPLNGVGVEAKTWEKQETQRR